MTKMTFCYGPDASQEGDLYLPDVRAPAVVCLLHGGFWRVPYDRDQFSSVALDLARRGYAVWNIGYRRIGERGGGWPGTFEDVARSIDHLAALSQTVAPLDLGKVAVVGHSAGGHLALCACAERHGSPHVHLSPKAVRPAAVAALAPVTDLAKAVETGLGGGAASALLGDSGGRADERETLASPMRLMPLRMPQLIVHGVHDTTVPCEFSRAYVRKARGAGDVVHYVELPGGGHMEYLDPTSEAHRTLCQWLGDRLKAPVGEASTAANAMT